jgi:hypothetical protein
MVPGNVFLYSDPGGWAARMGVGDILLEREAQAVQSIASTAWKFTSKGKTIGVFQGTHYTSDAADVMTDCDVIVGWSYKVERPEDMVNWPADESAKGPLMILSCRTRGTFDVGAFAKAHGGGGHTKAAGFTLRLKANDKNPYEMIKAVFDAYNV